MRVDDRLGSFSEVATAAGSHAPVLEALRAVVEELHPEAVETASRKEQTVGWGFDGGKGSHWYAYSRAFRSHVNLGFFHGVRLPDPDRLLEGTGKALRHVKLRDVVAARAPAVRALLLAARDERAAVLAGP